MIKKTIKRLVKLMLYLVIPVYIGYHYVAEKIYQANIPMGEVIGPDEDAVMADAIAMALNMINRTRGGLIEEGISGDETLEGKQPNLLMKLIRKLTGKDDIGKTTDRPVVFRRDVHIKSHGCVKAEFTVPELDNKYRWGVLREPGNYKAWIRYSNGDPTLLPDKARDARGMAIKLMGVEGEKLLPGQSEAETQDFVMMNATNYFIRHLEDYVELTKYLALGDNLGYFINGGSLRALNPFAWHWRELKLVMGTKKKPPTTPLTAQYFSASAYKLGPDNNIKFSAKPVACKDSNGEPLKGKEGSWATGKSDYNFLRLRMAEQLKAGPACFDFMVQLQVPGKIMPVEDSTIAWKEKDSPFVTVAQLKIPQQEFNNETQNQFCEDLSFNPWHSLPEHRPIGVFNRVRKALYEEVAKYRWDANRRQYDNPSAPALKNCQPPEPHNWQVPMADETTSSCSVENDEGGDE